MLRLAAQNAGLGGGTTRTERRWPVRRLGGSESPRGGRRAAEANAGAPTVQALAGTDQTTMPSTAPHATAEE
jgi:hypothetical protein